MASKDDSVTVEVKKAVKVVSKKVQKEEKQTKEQNGESNGDADVEAELVVKLPSKKSAAKTETRVEVTKQTLPDGSVEEVKKTITKTIIDGKTEIRTKTETTIIPKADDEEVEEEVEEEEEGEVVVQEVEENKKVVEEQKPDNSLEDKIIKTDEKSETTTTTTKRVVFVENDEKDDEEEVTAEEELEEEVVESEPVTVILKKPESPKAELIEEDEKNTENEVEEEQTVEQNIEQEIQSEDEINNEIEDSDENVVEENKEEVEKEEQKEEQEEVEELEENDKKPQVTEQKEEDFVEDEETEEVDEESEEVIEKESVETNVSDQLTKNNQKDEIKEEVENIQKEECKPKEVENESEVKTDVKVIHVEISSEPESKTPLIEPSVPLEKVEEVEIKPIGEVITKTHTANTEIITRTDKPDGPLSTQTEYNRVENIVTVNRTTKTLDRAYENITQQGIPTMKTYFAPSIDKVSTAPYQPVYPSEPTTERRHSLLLERLSVDRQMPSDLYQNNTSNYQYNNQTLEQQRQWSQEPQAEVVNVSNVKPSQITNSQWYQQNQNITYNNVSTPTPVSPVAPAWSQSKPIASPQPHYQPQPQYQAQPQPQYQSAPQPQYQSPPQHQSQPQHQYQPPSQPQYQPAQHTQYQPEPQYQSQPQQQYQQAYTENSLKQTNYSAYTPKPSWATDLTPTVNSQPQPYSYLNKDSSDSYQKTTQQYSSSYVPPPWEQDSSYVVDAPVPSQNYYQQPPKLNTYSPAASQGWKPTPLKSKFSKTPPKAYVPPAPNQSFVKPVTSADIQKQPERQTYYSEYERRFISVPESTYIPTETKPTYQPQPDPSPQYYYDNNDPTETVEHQWRKELREFTEQKQTHQSETVVKPPWEEDSLKYGKTPDATYTPTPTWSQTLRPRSNCERSFESEFAESQEWSKTSTLGRGRPLSSYNKSLESTIPERTRGVSVDRYNPHSYQSPLEHPPVQAYTLTTPVPHSGYNPNVPAYHARASVEPRDQSGYSAPQRIVKDLRVNPLQSRSFKYLQWITGTDD